MNWPAGNIAEFISDYLAKTNSTKAQTESRHKLKLRRPSHVVCLPNLRATKTDVVVAGGGGDTQKRTRNAGEKGRNKLDKCCLFSAVAGRAAASQP